MNVGNKKKDQAELLMKAKAALQYGNLYLGNKYIIEGNLKSNNELRKKPFRWEVINFLLSLNNSLATKYLEIGVRNPESNYNKILAIEKYGVDPGIENKSNPVEFKMTSDDFFTKLKDGEILKKNTKFDVIFIDGLHKANQVEKDIYNSLKYISDNGFIVIHDCNPPTEFHCRESYDFDLSPAGKMWNGTVWKAFYKLRFDKNVYCACIDSDWGIGIVSKLNYFKQLKKNINPYFEFDIFDANRAESLNLLSYQKFTKTLLRGPKLQKNLVQ